MSEGPEYYSRFVIEPKEFILRNNLTFWQGNIVKYIMRYDGKAGLEDLRKARRYLDMAINLLEGKDSL